jgi:hypothetical protein
MVRTEKRLRGRWRRLRFLYPYFTPQLPLKSSKHRSLGTLSAPRALAGALLALFLYAAFAHGAVGAGDEERLQLAICAVAVVAATAATWNGRLALAASRAGWTGLGLLIAFAFWSGLTVLWSVAPDQTWIECNRVITYVIVLALAIALGSSHPQAPRVLAGGLALVALLVTAYALGQKLLPGVRVGGVLNLDRTGSLPRLQDPLGYWNALGVFVAMGIAPVLAAVLDRGHGSRLRLAAAVAVLMMLVTLAFTYSRGAVLALAAAALIIVLAGGGRVRAALWVGACLAAAIPAAVIGLASAPLTAAGASLSAREKAGAELLLVLVASALLLVLLGRWMIALESRVVLGRARRRMIVRGLGATAAALAVIGVLALALAGRGLDGNLSHAWHSFTATRATGVYDPGRLLSADSENRWVWWKEAAGAFSARPLQGWGAGSFGVTHLLYRRDTLSVQQPHSVPLQFLAETGVVGAALALTALAALLHAAGQALRGSTARARPSAVALLAAAVAYALHSLYDWDWDIPALTMPALACLGVLIGAAQRGRAVDPEPSALRPRSLQRAAGCAAASACLALFAVSAIVPRLAASRAEHALLAASTPDTSALRGPLSGALGTGRLDPLSDAGLRAASAIALRRDDVALSRRLLVTAVEREPTDGQAWQQLTLVYQLLGDQRDALMTARRALALDPRGPLVAAVAQRAVLGLTPPAGSATAVPTPRRDTR